MVGFDDEVGGHGSLENHDCIIDGLTVLADGREDARHVVTTNVT